MKTEIAYVCSPPYEHHLFTSLRSLLVSGSKFDQITIYCIGSVPSYWETNEPNIRVKSLPPRIEGHFMSNKTHVCNSVFDRVVYLDVDTLIFEPLHEIWETKEGVDILARPANWYRPGLEWYEARLKSAGVASIPYFNCGFVIFQNGSHRRIGNEWFHFIKRVHAGELIDTNKGGGPDQLAFACAVSKLNLTYSLMTPKQHSFFWQNEPAQGSTVQHFGSGVFLDEATRWEVAHGLHKVQRPFFRNKLFNPILARRIQRTKAYFAKSFIKDRLRASLG